MDSSNLTSRSFSGLYCKDAIRTATQGDEAQMINLLLSHMTFDTLTLRNMLGATIGYGASAETRSAAFCVNGVSTAATV